MIQEKTPTRKINEKEARDMMKKTTSSL